MYLINNHVFQPQDLWTPLLLPNLRAFYSIEDTNGWQNTTATIRGVSRILDRSGNNFHMNYYQSGSAAVAQVVGEKYLEIINPSLNYFTGTYNNIVSAGSGNKTVIWLGRHRQNQNYSLIAGGVFSASSPYHSIILSYTNTTAVGGTYGTTIRHNFGRANTSFPISTWACVCYQYNVSIGGGLIDINGTNQSPTFVSPSNVISFTTSQNVSVGLGVSNSGLFNDIDACDMYFEGMIILDSLISNANKEKVQGWWANTFNHKDLLPVNHPYKINPPYI